MLRDLQVFRVQGLRVGRLVYRAYKGCQVKLHLRVSRLSFRGWDVTAYLKIR